ncbi:related to salicylate hydroxylase [Cephalotrichum gorgonifer]|uniref:Related to salicylate hydroxylase n=1 Tax=Cephalotrichum gorgonifer TaxID=2041049 RepID=A0AAE8MSH8_9PEZI|nr:related to salicylate hydroxylase [Cephalotrichum gorgonifer]
MRIREDRPDGIKIVVVGAGLAGLSAALSTKLANPAHEVVVYEAAKELQEIGYPRQAGLQITPNATKLLKRWSVFDELRPLAMEPKTLTVHRYDGTAVLAREPDLQGKVGELYGSPFWDLHRVDLQRALSSRCRSLGIPIVLSSRVARVSFDDATVELEGGAVTRADVVVCAEGLWSSTRSRFLGRASEPAPTGDMAYRISIDTTAMEGPHRDEILEFARTGGVNVWAGPHSHAVSYSVREGRVLNVGLLRPDDLPAETVKTTASAREVADLLSDWDPLLRRILTEVGEVQKWKLLWVEALPDWTSASGTFYMVGDSCHPMLPYLAQGANSALEDGAVLGTLLAKVVPARKDAQLRRVSEMYQALRRDRGAEIQRESFGQRTDFHLPDGEAQKARDARMVAALERDSGPDEGFPSRWTCPRVQRFLYGYDAYAEAERAYKADPF